MTTSRASILGTPRENVEANVAAVVPSGHTNNMVLPADTLFCRLRPHYCTTILSLGILSSVLPSCCCPYGPVIRCLLLCRVVGLALPVTLMHW